MSTASASPSMAGTLYRDALQSIFQFLFLAEFVRTCPVNRSWYSSGRTMKPRQDCLWFKGSINSLAESPFRIHIGELHLYNDTIPPTALSLLRAGMGHLDKLAIRIKITKSDLLEWVSASLESLGGMVESLFSIPQQLQSLSIEFYFDQSCTLKEAEKARSYLAACLNQIASQSTRLVKLNLDITAEPIPPAEIDSDDGVDWGLDLGYDGGDAAVAEPLVPPPIVFDFDEMDDGRAVRFTRDCLYELHNLTTLTEITLSRPFAMNQQIDFIKSAPSIHCWHTFHGLTTQSIQRLVEGSGPPSHLEDIVIGLLTVDEAYATQFKQLVSLTRLNIQLDIHDPTQFLPCFPRLSVLILVCELSVDPDLLTQALSTSTKLVDLQLRHCSLTSGHVAQFLPHLCSLQVLQLTGCVCLNSLEFLSTAKESLSHLRKFGIYQSSQLSVQEYQHLNAISSSLESLAIYESTTEPFDPSTIAGLTPSSVEFRRSAWPRLRQSILTNHAPEYWD